MRTSTIYRAMSGAYRTILFTQTVDDFLHRKARQWAKFERELLRRIEERDAIQPALVRISDAYYDWVAVFSPPEEAVAFGRLESAIFDANATIGREDMFNS